MDKLILNSLSKEDLKDLILDVINKSLDDRLKDSSASKEFLNVNELCEYLNIKPQTVYNLCSRKVMPYIKKMGKLYFKKEDIDNWLLDNSQS
jgi:excisionase family DNA binding protein